MKGRALVVAVLCAIAGDAAIHVPSAAAQTGTGRPSQARILVMPFDNVKREGRLFWLTEASAVLLADDLNALGASAIAREERLQAFDRLKVPPAASLSDATVIRIGQLVGAAQVILGSLQLEGDTLAVRARSIALDTGRVTTDVTARGPIDELFPTFEHVARQIFPSKRSSDELQRTHPAMPVFENYIKGLLAETPATAVNYLNAALKQDATFDRARLALWDVYAEQEDHLRALAAVTPVRDDSPWTRRARFLSGLSQLNLRKFDDAFATFKALADAKPTATALNNIGIVQLRRSGAQPTGEATYYFNKAATTDPDDPDYVFNLGYAYWQNRDPQAALYWLRETVRRSPADGDAHYVLGAVLASVGNATEAIRERELAKRLSSTYAEWEKRPGVEAVPKGLERLKHEVELPHARRIETTLAASEQRDQAALATFYLDRGRRLFDKETDREAVVELNHALYLSPYLADAHLLLGRIHLRNGRVREAIDAFKIALWSAETADAHVALGEAFLQADDLTAARAEANRALAMKPDLAEAKQLLAKLDKK